MSIYSVIIKFYNNFIYLLNKQAVVLFAFQDLRASDITIRLVHIPLLCAAFPRAILPENSHAMVRYGRSLMLGEEKKLFSEHVRRFISLNEGIKKDCDC